MAPFVPAVKGNGVRLTDKANTLYDNDIGLNRVNSQIRLTSGATFADSAGVKLGTVLAADEKLYFEGAGSDTYIVYNTSQTRLEVWVNGSMKIAWS